MSLARVSLAALRSLRVQPQQAAAERAQPQAAEHCAAALPGVQAQHCAALRPVLREAAWARARAVLHWTAVPCLQVRRLWMQRARSVTPPLVLRQLMSACSVAQAISSPPWVHVLPVPPRPVACRIRAAKACLRPAANSSPLPRPGVRERGPAGQQVTQSRGTQWARGSLRALALRRAFALPQMRTQQRMEAQQRQVAARDRMTLASAVPRRMRFARRMAPGRTTQAPTAARRWQAWRAKPPVAPPSPP